MKNADDKPLSGCLGNEKRTTLRRQPLRFLNLQLSELKENVK